jgi:bacterioferritin
MEKQEEIIKELQKAYWKELESVMNYLANSENLDGIRAEEIRETLSQEVQDEVGHAQQLASRIKELNGTVPGSMEFKAEQKSAQPPEKTTDVKHVVKGVVDAEEDAIAHYRKIVDLTDGVDHVTQDLVISLQADEEKHLRLFRGFLKDLDLDS